MSKVELNIVAAVLKEEQVEPAKLRAIIERLNQELAAQAGDEEKQPAVKKQYVLLVSDPERTLPNRDYVGWVLQLPENESPATTLDRIYRAGYDFNASKRGRLLPVKTVGEALECVPAKHFKQADVWVKTKTPVLLVRTDNEIPREEVEK